MTIEITAHRDIVVAILPANGDHKQRFIAFNRHEAHDLVTRIIQAIAQADGYRAAADGRVPEPKPIPQRSSPRKRSTRGK